MFAGVACALAPLMVALIELAYRRGTFRIDRALLYPGMSALYQPSFWLWMFIPAVITFLVLLPLLRSRLLRLTVYGVLVYGWLTLRMG